MPVTNTSYIPYATAGRVIAVIRKLREDRMPDKVDQTALTRIGIPEGSTLRVIAALKFLGLINEGSNKTELADRLARAKSDEYPTVLAEIVRAAYSDIFVHLDPATANEIDFHDSFRGFDPAKQRSRMIALFVGLCQEANIMEGEPTIVHVNRPTERKPSPAGNGTGAINGKPATRKPAEELPPPPRENPQAPPQFVPPSDKVVLWAWFASLPANNEWKMEDQENWLSGVTSAVKYQIKITGGERGVAIDSQ